MGQILAWNGQGGDMALFSGALKHFTDARDRKYSWIGHGLQRGPTLAFSLWLSEFKTKALGHIRTKRIEKSNGLLLHILLPRTTFDNLTVMENLMITTKEEQWRRRSNTLDNNNH